MFKGFNSRIARPSADPKVQMLKLTRKAMGMVSGSPAQKAVIKKLNVYRKELGMEPLTEVLDIAKLKTQQHKLLPINWTKYKKRAGLEGPFMTKAGQVVYFDKIKGQYYNPDNDMYLSYNDWKKLSEETIDEGKRLGNISQALLNLSKKPEFKKISKNLVSLSMRAKENDKNAPTQIYNQLAKLSHKVAKKPGMQLYKIGRLAQTYEGIEEEVPANATGTAVAGSGDDSSTVVVKKKKPLQDKLMRRLKIKESIDRAVPDLEYPKDKITERKQQLIDLAKKYGENI